MFRFFYIITYPITIIMLILIIIYRSIVRYIIRPSCRFLPSCSKYALDTIKEFGVIYGGYLTIKRLIKCRPNGQAGYDFVKFNLLGNYKWKC